jgi:hypothetical protein
MHLALAESRDSLPFVRRSSMIWIMQPSRLIAVAALLTTLAACSSSPPTYKWPGGNACALLGTGEMTDLVGTGATGDPVPSELKPGYTGGNCKNEIRGDLGEVTLESLIMVHSDEDAAKATYDQLKKSEFNRSDSDVTHGDLKSLGSQAYWTRTLSASRPWKPGDPLLYKVVVQDGTLMLSLLFSGFAHSGHESQWPQNEKDIHTRVERTAKNIMTKLSH